MGYTALIIHFHIRYCLLCSWAEMKDAWPSVFYLHYFFCVHLWIKHHNLHRLTSSISELWRSSNVFRDYVQCFWLFRPAAKHFGHEPESGTEWMCQLAGSRETNISAAEGGWNGALGHHPVPQHSHLLQHPIYDYNLSSVTVALRSVTAGLDIVWLL